jgi:superfamily II DNA or RNA helicase
VSDERTIKIIAREAFFIPRDQIKKKDVAKLEKRYTHLFFEEKACKRCEYLDDRLDAFPKVAEVCQTCAGFLGGKLLCLPHEENGKKYIRIPAGDPKEVKKLFKARGYKIKWNVKHPDVPMKRPIKFIGELRKEQPKCFADVVSGQRGFLIAPPRAGKTVLGAAITCHFGQKTLIMASQRDWLDGFVETFIGSDTQERLTNCKKKQIGFCKTLQDFKKYDVCLVTVQTFHTSKGRKLLKKIRDLFGLLLVDEIHGAAADKYSTVLANLNVGKLVALTGTPDRKDGRFPIVQDLVGPVLHEMKTKRLRPTIKLTRSPYKELNRRMMWTTIVTKLESDPARLKLIAKTAIKDVKAGHLVMIPLNRVAVIDALVMAINRMAGKDIARPFHGKVHKDLRKHYIQRARKYKIKVMVGQARVMSTGINIPRASCIYDVTPSNNKPQAIQRISRILTPYDDKPPPLLRIFLDDSNARRRCLMAEYFNVMKRVFNARISDIDEQLLNAYFKAGYRPSFRDGGTDDYSSEPF